MNVSRWDKDSQAVVSGHNIYSSYVEVLKNNFHIRTRPNIPKEVNPTWNGDVQEQTMLSQSNGRKSSFLNHNVLVFGLFSGNNIHADCVFGLHALCLLWAAQQA